MTQAWQLRLSFRTSPRASALALAFAIAFALSVAVAPTAQAQTYTVIHNFDGIPDGYEPLAGVTMDAGGNLYGTAHSGGRTQSVGIVYKLARRGSGWFFTTLYAFQGESDGAFPASGVIFGPDGSLYGTTASGGSSGAGVVFNLRPSARACVTALCPWGETVIYNFTGSNGSDPNGLVFNPAGDLYGTTVLGGGSDSGVIYELMPSNGSWTGTVLHSLIGGEQTFAGVILDQSGNLYGTAVEFDAGIVYELTAQGEWQVLHRLTGSDGYGLFGGLIFDNAGNLYGTTSGGGPDGGGTVFELSPSGGEWILNTLYGFAGDGCSGTPIGYYSLAMDAAGNLYGTAPCAGAYGKGAVFKLTPASGGWTYTSLHDFCAGGFPCSDGAIPFSTIVFDSRGNLYGTASQGGAYGDGEPGYGVVWEITP